MKPLCKLITPESGAAAGSKVYMPDGQEIPGVVSFELPRVGYNDVVTVKLEMNCQLSVIAHPVFDLEFLKQAAAAHGMRLVQRAPTVR